MEGKDIGEARRMEENLRQELERAKSKASELAVSLSAELESEREIRKQVEEQSQALAEREEEMRKLAERETCVSAEDRLRDEEDRRRALEKELWTFVKKRNVKSERQSRLKQVQKSRSPISVKLQRSGKASS